MNQDEFLHIIANSQDVHDVCQRQVLVALSGGADSVALLRALLQLGCRCKAAHCNFHLRGEESMRDERFVRNLCNRLDVPLTVKDFDVAAWQQEHGGSVEMACRDMRYEWFEQERLRQQCEFIAVAHHADDQVETFFLNLLRGTGLKGLTGMQRLNGRIWRPLLDVTRDDIINYLTAIGQDYVTDCTNASNDYRRNRLRNMVLPLIKQQFPASVDRILDTMEHLRSDHKLTAALVAEILPDERHIDIEPLLQRESLAPTLLYYRVRHFGFNHDQCEQAITAALQGHTGSKFVGNGVLLVVNRRTIDIESANAVNDTVVPVDLSDDVQHPIHITVSRNNAPFSPLMCDGRNKVAFNSDVLHCQRIVLRHWKQGDRIKPFGMNGSKLVSDLFADLKMDHASKHATWLLEADGEILWVLGYRASGLYAVQPESQDYVLLQISR